MVAAHRAAVAAFVMTFGAIMLIVVRKYCSGQDLLSSAASELSLSACRWDGSAWRSPLPTSLAESLWLSKVEAQSCLTQRWIYVVGDSSTRSVFRALIHVLNPEFTDERYGSWITNHKGGCTGKLPKQPGDFRKGDFRGEEEAGDVGGGCLREYFDRERGIRITFSFKTYSTQSIKAMDWLTSESHTPDLIITATGAWDLTYRLKASKRADYAPATPEQLTESVSTTQKWVDDLAEKFPLARVLSMTLVSCHEELHKRALGREWNKQLRETGVLAEGGWGERVLWLDREPTTKINGSHCEGWHAYGPIVMQHVHIVLRAICGCN